MHLPISPSQTSEEHYRTAATSPFPLSNSISADAVQSVGLHQVNENQIPQIIVSQQTVNTTVLSTAPGGATIERGMPVTEAEMRRSHQRSYDEYESDDELRREDISFTIDGGMEIQQIFFNFFFQLSKHHLRYIGIFSLDRKTVR